MRDRRLLRLPDEFPEDRPGETNVLVVLLLDDVADAGRHVDVLLRLPDLRCKRLELLLPPQILSMPGRRLPVGIQSKNGFVAGRCLIIAAGAPEDPSFVLPGKNMLRIQFERLIAAGDGILNPPHAGERVPLPLPGRRVVRVDGERPVKTGSSLGVTTGLEKSKTPPPPEERIVRRVFECLVVAGDRPVVIPGAALS